MILMHVSMLSFLSRVWLFATPWTVACLSPLSIRFSRQEYVNGLSWPPPGDLSDPRIGSASPVCPASAWGSFTTSATLEVHDSSSPTLFNGNWLLLLMILDSDILSFCIVTYQNTDVIPITFLPSQENIYMYIA